MAKKYFLYLLRWQLSTIILAPCLMLFSGLGPVWSAVIANLIGAIIMYPVDKYIFKEK